MVEGAEDNLFRSCFSAWPSPTVNLPTKIDPEPGQIKKQSVDLSGFYKRQRKEELMQDDVRDDGSGTIKVLHLHDL